LRWLPVDFPYPETRTQAQKRRRPGRSLATLVPMGDAVMQRNSGSSQIPVSQQRSCPIDLAIDATQAEALGGTERIAGVLTKEVEFATAAGDRARAER
jgi:hypothetical protein